jgi:NCS1 nucleoside transporter family
MKNNNQLLIDNSQQTFKILDIASIWAGITICLPSFMLGGILVPSFSFKQAILITIVGNLILALLIYLMALPGTYTGSSAALLNRQIFGYPQGNFIPSLAVVISLIGWSAILLNLAGQAAYEIIDYYQISFPPIFIIVIIGFLVLASSFAGPEKIKSISKLSLPALIVIACWLFYQIFSQYNLGELLIYQPTNDFKFMEALNLIVGGTIVGAFVSSDLCRYARSKKEMGLGILLGTLPAATILAIIGILSRLATGYWNPVYIIKSLGMGIPALLLIIISTWTTIQASIYSASLSLSGLLPAITRKTGTLLIGFILILLAVINIMNFFELWLLLLNNLFAPMIAVSLLKYFFYPDNKPKRVDWKVVLSIFGSILLVNLITTPLPSFLVTMLWSCFLYFILQHYSAVFN